MMKYRICTFLVLLSIGFLACGQEPSEARPLNYVEGNLRFEFTHSLRIRDYHITVDFYRRPWSDKDSVEMRVISQPMPGHEKEWDGSMVDRTTKVAFAEYERLYQMALSLRIEDLLIDMDVIGDDGNTCTITFGGFQTSVALTAWGPDFDSERRGLDQFYKVCKAFLEVGGFKPGKIF